MSKSSDKPQATLKFTSALTRYAADSEEERWEDNLRIANQNRQILAALHDNDWIGLRILALVKSFPSGIHSLSTQLQVDPIVIKSFARRLFDSGLVEETGDDLYWCSERGADVLQKLEECTDFT